MKHRIRTGLAGLVIAAVAAPAAGAAEVTVRAEGATETIVEQISVPANGPSVTKQGATCAGDSAGGALDRAVQGDWDGTAFSFGLSVDRIRTENLPFESKKYWAFDVNNAASSVGVCDYKLQDGDEILFYTACAGAESGCFTGQPLDVIAPAGARPGKAFTVTVLEYDDTKTPPVSTRAAGATVTAGDVTATTGADGTARITIPKAGRATVVATKGTQVRDSAVVAVGVGAYAVDKTAPVTRIKGIKNGARLAKGPRKLRARIAEASALKSVELSLTRRVGGTCTAFDGAAERFVRIKCGKSRAFAVPTGKKLSYLLPGRLDVGRYRLTVLATDRAGNRERVKRGRNQVSFLVS